MKEPYLMTREEWYAEKEKTAIRHGQCNYTKNSKNEEVLRIERLQFLLFGVGEWLYKKAYTENWALEAIDTGYYDRYLVNLLNI